MYYYVVSLGYLKLNVFLKLMAAPTVAAVASGAVTTLSACSGVATSG